MNQQEEKLQEISETIMQYHEQIKQLETTILTSGVEWNPFRIMNIKHKINVLSNDLIALKKCINEKSVLENIDC